MTEKNIGISQCTLVSQSEKNENQPRKLPQYIASLASALGAFAAGMVIGWTSPAGDDGAELNKSGGYSFIVDSDDFSWASSTFNLGAATICVPIGILCDIVGRRTAMLMITVPFTIGWSCVIWPNSPSTLIVGRYILGVSSGAFCVTVPMYTAEIADTETRGRLGSYYELLLDSGILFAYILGSFNAISMLKLSIISSFLPLLFFAVFFFMPETPTYYLMKDNVEMARKSLAWLRGPQYDVDNELDEKREILAEAKRNRVSFHVAIKSRAAVKGLVIAFGLMFFQQMSGCNAIVFYGASIFKEATGDESSWPTIVVAGVQVIAVFFSGLFVDRLGRRLLLLVSSASMCVTTFVLGIYFYLDKFGPSMENFRWLPLLCVCCFIAMISIGLGPISWVVIAEIFSPQIKGVAGSSACLFNWLVAFVVTKFYGNMTDAVGIYGTFWIFSSMCGLGVIFVFFIVPETKGKTLEQIQIELGGDLAFDEQLPTKT